MDVNTVLLMTGLFNNCSDLHLRRTIQISELSLFVESLFVHVVCGASICFFFLYRMLHLYSNAVFVGCTIQYSTVVFYSVIIKVLHVRVIQIRANP